MSGTSLQPKGVGAESGVMDKDVDACGLSTSGLRAACKVNMDGSIHFRHDSEVGETAIDERRVCVCTEGEEGVGIDGKVGPVQCCTRV
jgi:hypothetical protein